MKAPLLVLIAAHIAFSFPLKTGTRLGYNVATAINKSFLTLEFFEITGSIRKIAIRDSNLSTGVVGVDTVELRGDGADAAWNRSSCLFPVEPAPRKPGTGYGRLGMDCLIQGSDIVPITNVSIDDEKIHYTAILFYTKDLPRARFASDTGIVRYVDDAFNWSCTLVEFNGQKLVGPNHWDVSRVLDVPMRTGDAWTWSVHRSLEGGSIRTSWARADWGTVRWTVLDALPDTLGWVRRKIRSHAILSSWSKIAMASDTTFVKDSVITRDLYLRLGPSGEFSLGGDWYDALTGNGFLREWWEDEILPGQVQWRISNSGTGPIGDLDVQKERIRGGVGLDSAYYRADGSETSEISVRLESFDTSGTVPSGMARFKAAKGVGLQKVLAMLRENPRTVVSIFDVSGGSRQLSGERAIAYLQGSRSWAYLRVEGCEIERDAHPSETD